MNQILDIVNTGIVIIDKQYKVREWNHWMAIHSGITKEDVVGNNIFNKFPELNSPSFQRIFKSVMSMGITTYLSHRLHKYLFPCRLTGVYSSVFENMQQRCTLAPVINENKEIDGVLITVIDVTESMVLEKNLKEINLIDSLTQIYNRRFLDKKLKEEFLRYKRHSIPFSIMMMDLDNFKRVNDTYGHYMGDFVLKNLSAKIKNLIRGSDILTRFGGEEFCCILPDTDERGAFIIAERVRLAVAEHEIISNMITINLTISLGVAQINSEMADQNELIIIADKAMYKAKKEGRNQVCHGSEIIMN